MIPQLQPEALEEQTPEQQAEQQQAEEKNLVRYDLACGQSKTPGYIGVDVAQIDGVDIVHDLRFEPWPIESDSVDHVVCSHFIEHLDGEEFITFMNELWRILKPGAHALLIAPYGWHSRAWQDPTHKRPIVAETFYYFEKNHREAMKTTHGPYARIRCNFDANVVCMLDNSIAVKAEEFRKFAMVHYVNSVTDLHVTVTKKALDAG